MSENYSGNYPVITATLIPDEEYAWDEEKGTGFCVSGKISLQVIHLHYWELNNLYDEDYDCDGIFTCSCGQTKAREGGGLGHNEYYNEEEATMPGDNSWGSRTYYCRREGCTYTKTVDYAIVTYQLDEELVDEGYELEGGNSVDYYFEEGEELVFPPLRLGSQPESEFEYCCYTDSSCEEQYLIAKGTKLSKDVCPTGRMTLYCKRTVLSAAKSTLSMPVMALRQASPESADLNSTGPETEIRVEMVAVTPDMSGSSTEQTQKLSIAPAEQPKEAAAQSAEKPEESAETSPESTGDPAVAPETESTETEPAATEPAETLPGETFVPRLIQVGVGSEIFAENTSVGILEKAMIAYATGKTAGGWIEIQYNRGGSIESGFTRDYNLYEIGNPDAYKEESETAVKYGDWYLEPAVFEKPETEAEQETQESAELPESEEALPESESEAGDPEDKKDPATPTDLQAKDEA